MLFTSQSPSKEVSDEKGCNRFDIVCRYLTNWETNSFTGSGNRREITVGNDGVVGFNFFNNYA